MNLMNTPNLPRPVWDSSDPTGGTPAPEPTGTPTGDPAPEPTAEIDYSFLPEEFRQEGNNDITGFRARYDEMVAENAMRNEALENVPEDGTGYEFALPEDIDYGDLELPDDFGFEIQSDDPALAPVFEDFGNLLHKYNIPKEGASEFMSLLAQYRAAEYAPLWQQGKAEMEALGKSADSRIANIERAVGNRLPEEQANAIMAMTTTAAGVKALEALLKPRGTPPTPPTNTPKTVDDDIADYYAKPSAQGA